MKREQLRGDSRNSVRGKDADAIAEQIDEKLRSLRSSIKLYAGPAKADFNARDIHLVWVANRDACAECRAYADGSPYRHGTLNSWPGLTSCGNLCRCYITAFKPDWDAVFDRHPSPEE